MIDNQTAEVLWLRGYGDKDIAWQMKTKGLSCSVYDVRAWRRKKGLPSQCRRRKGETYGLVTAGETLEAVANAASKMGMSYGQYMALKSVM